MKNFNSLCLLLAVVTTPSLTLNANKTRIRDGHPKIVLPTNTDFKKSTPGNGVTTYVPVMKSASGTEENVKITIKASSLSGVNPSQVSVYNKDCKIVEYMNGSSKKLSIPAGTYDMFVSFYGGTSYYVFKENVTLEDGAVYEFNQEEATNDVTFRFYDENFKELFMDVYNGSNLQTHGTADSMSKITGIVHRDYGSSALIISMGYMPLKYPMEFFINNVSDKYIVAHGANIIANGTTYTYKCGITEFKPGIEISFDGDELIKCTTELDANELMPGDGPKFVPGFNMSLLWNGISLAGETSFLPKSASDSKTVTNYMYCPESDNTTDDMVNVIYAPVIANYWETDEDDYGTYTNYYGMSGCAMLGDKNGVKYINAGADLDWGGFNVPEGTLDAQYYPGHPDLSFENTDGVMSYPQACPIATLRAMRYDMDGYIDGWDRAYFVGRYGEMYEGEAWLLYPNEEILDDGSSKTSVSNTFVNVDGLEGHNNMEAYFDLNKEDFSAPTVQMLTFKNADGKITDRLKSRDGAKIIITGGDFKYHMNFDKWIGSFSCHEATLKVSYAPYGTEDWKELPMTEIPEKKFMPYFGNYYEGSLDKIECTHDNQWFDLNIVISDAAGNYQTQIVSPAFKILSATSGIASTAATPCCFSYSNKTVSCDTIADFELRDIAGTLVSTAHGNGISVCGLTRGAYIVTARTTANGSVTKKILVD